MTPSPTPQAHEEKLVRVREWIMKACPDLLNQGCDKCGMNYVNGTRCVYCTGIRIGLPEVLRALPGNYAIDADGHFLTYNEHGWNMPPPIVLWNLLLPLDQQEPPVIDFLFSLLPQ